MAPGGAGGLVGLNISLADGAGDGFPGTTGTPGGGGLAGDDGFESAGPIWSGGDGGTGGTGTPGGAARRAAWICACSPAICLGARAVAVAPAVRAASECGHAGGGSFALYLWNSSASVSNSTPIAGDGGEGGAGGVGGEGGAGSAGGMGGTGLIFDTARRRAEPEIGRHWWRGAAGPAARAGRLPGRDRRHRSTQAP
jgi:hypothetical protein